MAVNKKAKQTAARGVGDYKKMLATGEPKTRPPKTPKIPSFMRTVIGENVRRRMEWVFRDSPNKPLALARKTGMPKEGGLSLSTIQRIIAGHTGATLDNLEAVADALDLSLYQLMIPALDPENPQVVPGALQEEERMYKRWKRGQDQPGKMPAVADTAGAH